MSESIETPKEQFRFPNIEAERGEFERVAEKFDVACDTLMFLAEEEGKVTALDKDMWGVLDNTSSKSIEFGDWGGVEHALREDGVERNWKELREKMKNSEVLDAPIILKIGDLYHLVSGNTRLMVARALGMTPKVLIFEYTYDRTDEV